MVTQSALRTSVFVLKQFERLADALTGLHGISQRVALAFQRAVMYTSSL